MTFWQHSFKARREQDHGVLFKGERDIAAAALAGVVIEPKFSDVLRKVVFIVTMPDGTPGGFNDTREQAAAFALWEMERGIGLPTKAR